MIVSDASPMIALSKIRRLALLRDLYEEVLISPVVRHEVLGQVEHVRPAEVAPVHTGVREGWIREAGLDAHEQDLAEHLSRNSRIHSGEAESIALAASRRLPLIVDDKEARAIAGANRVSYLGTAAVLLNGYRKAVYDISALEDALRDLGSVIWMSPAVGTEILRRAREFRQ